MTFKLFNRYWSKVAASSLLLEALLLFLSAWIGFQIRFHSSKGSFLSDEYFWYRSTVFVIVVLISMYLNGMYEFSARPSKLYTGIYLVRSLTFAALALWGIYYVFPALFLGRGVLALSFVFAGGLIGAWRLIMIRVVADHVFKESILVVGTDSSAKRLVEETLENGHLGYEIVGFLDDDPNRLGDSIINPEVLGSTAEALKICQSLGVSEVVVAQRDTRGKLDLDHLLACKTTGIRVTRGADFLERLSGRLNLDEPRIRSWLLFSSGFVISRPMLLMKRTIDIAVAVVLLVLSAPVIILTAVAVRLDSSGPLLYRQSRLGKGKVPFTLLKFRSMYSDSEAVGGAQWATEDDPRVTRIGRLIRSARVDELPQLLNVLRGQMTLVGPRPERPEFASRLSEMSPFYDIRLSVRPGLTGWAQIKAPYAATFEESLDKLRYDLFYIKHFSPFLDLTIMASTIRIVLIGRGAR